MRANKKLVFKKPKKSWKKCLTDSTELPLPRQGHTTCLYENNFFLFGGVDDYSGFNDVWRFNLDTREWEEIIITNIELQPERRRFHAACAPPSEYGMYIFGGNDDMDYFNDLWFFNFNSLSFEFIDVPEENSPPKRSGHSMLPYLDKLIVFGGYGGYGVYELYFDDLWIFDIKNNKWNHQKTHGSSPSPRLSHSACIFKQYLIIFGGYFRTRLNDLHILDLNTFTWKQINTPPFLTPSPRSCASFVVYKHFAILFGGMSGTKEEGYIDFNDGYVLNLDDFKWCNALEYKNAPNKRHNHSAFIFRDAMYIIGGKSCGDKKNNGKYLNDIHYLDLQIHPNYKIWRLNSFFDVKFKNIIG